MATRSTTSVWLAPAPTKFSWICWATTRATSRFTFQNYLRTHKPRFLAVWGKNDPFFVPHGAEALRRDIPSAMIARYLRQASPAVCGILEVLARQYGAIGTEIASIGKNIMVLHRAFEEPAVGRDPQHRPDLRHRAGCPLRVVHNAKRRRRLLCFATCRTNILDYLL
jgi:hypothetical protein